MPGDWEIWDWEADDDLEDELVYAIGDLTGAAGSVARASANGARLTLKIDSEDFGPEYDYRVVADVSRCGSTVWIERRTRGDATA